MATKPLFVESVEVMIDLLKLNQIEEEGSTLAIVQETIRDVTVAFHRKLGKARIDVLKAIIFVDPPVTDNDFLAVLARVTERKWVRLKLMQELPILFANPGNTFGTYEEEAPYTENTSDLHRAMKALRSEIEENLEFLEGAESAGNETTVKVSTLEPAVEPLLPGDTAWGS